MAENTSLKEQQIIYPYFRKILFHEIFMGLLLCQILVRLVISGRSWNWITAYIIAVSLYVFLIWIGIKTLSPLTNRIRLIANIFLMNFAFASIRYVIPILGKKPLDSVLTSIELRIFGQDLSLWAQQFYSKPLTEVMSIGYMLFIIFLGITFIYYSFKAELDKLCRFCTGLFTLYGLGISGYTLVPAQGPYVYLAGAYTHQLEGYLFTDMNRVMVSYGSAGYDVFPSLHVAVGLFLLLFYRKYDRVLFRCYFMPFIFLVLSTIYLRYHYMIDLIAGIPLSILCFVVGEKVFRKISSPETYKQPAQDKMAINI